MKKSKLQFPNTDDSSPNNFTLASHIEFYSEPKYDGKFYEMLVFLLDHGCDVNLQNKHRYNSTALHYVLNPMVGWVDYYSNRATDVGFRSDSVEGMSFSRIPFDKIDVVFRRKVEIIKLLLSRGALNLVDSNGLNPVTISLNLAARINAFPGPEFEKKYYREISQFQCETYFK